MAQSAVKWEMNWPNFGMAATPAFATFGTLDAASEYVAGVFIAQQAMTVDRVTFRAGTATGSPTVTVRIEKVGTDGLPNGVLWDDPTNTTTGTSGTISSNTNPIVTLTAAATIARGDVFAVVVTYASGTSVVIQFIDGIAENFGNPYAVVATPTAAKSTLGGSGNGSQAFGLGSAASSYYATSGSIPVSAITSATFNSSAARGLWFKAPFSGTLSGMLWVGTGASNGDFDIKLYAEDGTTELASGSYDGDHWRSVGTNPGRFLFDTPYELTAGTRYCAMVVATSATNVNFQTMVVLGSDQMGASPFGPDDCYATRTAGGTWDVSATTTIPVMDLLFSAFSDGAGGGGGSSFSASIG